ncbi:MAG: hypothetical protein ACTSUR_03755 [Candidatus Heimdallarchaeaceae archaeon]
MSIELEQIELINKILEKLGGQTLFHSGKKYCIDTELSTIKGRFKP